MTKSTLPGSARPTGLFRPILSEVIEDEPPQLDPRTREQVEQFIAEVGYVPESQSVAIAPEPRLLIALVHDNADPQLALIVQNGMLAAMADSDHALAIHPIGVDPVLAARDLRDFIEKHRPAGVVLLPPGAENEGLIAVCRELGCNYVRFSAAADDAPAHLVASDDRTAIAHAVSRLAALGHERIGLVAGPEDDAAARERELGYLDAMADLELDRGPALIGSGDFSFASGLSAGRLLLQVSPRPTAIIAASDSMAAGVLHAAREKNLNVPGALSIIGFGDTPLAPQLWPTLTTVRLPALEMAYAAALKLIRPETAANLPVVFAAELIERASSAAAKD